jgi:hypothetical protein
MFHEFFNAVWVSFTVRKPLNLPLRYALSLSRDVVPEFRLIDPPVWAHQHQWLFRTSSVLRKLFCRLY